MELKGYMVVKVRKTINILLFSENKEELIDFFENDMNIDLRKNGMQIVPVYDKGKEEYIKLNDKYIRING